ncbi:hypothetical protein EHS25_004147 [Saitozyma podzolica]|uniref:Anaphase-promoting complex subunit 5 n=1 Tax=Saitozyma podzolica TaxID=1890683 RepID=A0A427YT89_9TREE|nr:hypothetical protein EHS25_004147 [Saitozyma podzolica]
MSTDPLARVDPPAAAVVTPIATFRKRSPDHFDTPSGETKLPDVASIGSTSATTVGNTSTKPFQHDPGAATKALGLLLLSLHLLRIGIDSKELSYAERVAFGLEFATVGFKVLNILREAKAMPPDKAPELPPVDVTKLVADMQGAIGSSMSIAQRNPSLKAMSQTLEILNARLAFDDHAHRYALMLLLMQLLLEEHVDALVVLSELIDEASARGHRQIVQAACLARLRILFSHRRWDAIPAALEDLAAAIGWVDDHAAVLSRDVWNVSCTAHYILLRCLWEARVGRDAVVKSLLKTAYDILDKAAVAGTFERFRADGGVVTSLLVQSTPPNVLYILTFLVTVICRRDYMGPSRSCKNLAHSRAVREWADIARKDDMWDVTFHPAHSAAEALAWQRQVQRLRADAMLEEMTARVYRCEVELVDELFGDIVRHMRENGLVPDLAPHLCLLYGHYAHILGYDAAASRYYLACKGLILPGSELGLVASVSLLAVLGQLVGAPQDHETQAVVNDLASKCAASSSAALNAVGQLLACLTDGHLMTSKKKLSAAYDICHRSGNNILRALVFAFTTSTHLTGSEDRILKQLETGREIAAQMGGKDREDGVGLVALGLWFGVKLKRWYRMNKRDEELAAARLSVEAHGRRLHDLTQHGAQRFPASSSRLTGLAV